MRSLGILLVLLVWVLLGWKMCTDHQRCCLEDTDTIGVTDDSETQSTAPLSKEDCPGGLLCFLPGSSDVIVGESFDAYKDSITALISDDKMLRITGVYSSGESDDESTSNLGYARASSIRALFNNLTDDQVALQDQLVVGRNLSSNELYSMNVLEMISAQTITGSAGEPASAQDEDSDSGRPGISMNAVIYFPFNSTAKLDDAQIESYLDDVAKRIVNSGERVRLTGHTDNIGSSESNITLGQKRANIIADYLIGKGVRRSQIISESKGETQPVASNSTEVGRAKNRRTELQIIQ